MTHIERRFIRHPARMPIQFDLRGDAVSRSDYLRNVSDGGVCFATDVELTPGRGIRLVIPVFDRRYEATGTVAWCRPVGQGFEVGVRFVTAQDWFGVRMVEQLVYIEDYRAEVARKEGRRLSREQAAEEWIEHFAARFPGLQ